MQFISSLYRRQLKKLKLIVNLLKFAKNNPDIAKQFLVEYRGQILAAISKLVGGLIFLLCLWKYVVKPRFFSKPQLRSPLALSQQRGWDWVHMRSQIREGAIPLPAAFVDLTILRQNLRRFAMIASSHKKTIRIATKSIRCPSLIQFILNGGSFSSSSPSKTRHSTPLSTSTSTSSTFPSSEIDLDWSSIFQGVMCYNIEEAAFLHDALGLDDILVAYPISQPHQLSLAFRLTQAGVRLLLTVDSLAHVHALKAHWDAQPSAPHRPALISLDVDVSCRPLGRLLHLGAQRSPLRDAAQVRRILAYLQDPTVAASVSLEAAMAYDAHVAGLPDASPHDSGVARLGKQLFRHFAMRLVASRRRELADLFAAHGVALRAFNGGGTGSFQDSVQEPWLTEVTVGSGLLQSALFDYYHDSQNQPAIVFALPIARVPQQGIVTCHAGGFIASGAVDPAKQPEPFLPIGMAATAAEGYGEVQTPIWLPVETQRALSIMPGDPLLFRPAKAGEIAESFNHYYLFDHGVYVTKALTYRGNGHVFH